MSSESGRRSPRVLIVKRRPLRASETFINAHIEGIPNTTFYCPKFPKGFRRLATAALIRARKEYLTQGWRAALRDYQPDVVLAEYGTSGVAVMHACQHYGVPLVVYFHGYDATDEMTLARHRKDYPRLFECASAIIAASDQLAKRLIALGASASQMHHIPCGVDTSLFQGARPGLAAPKVVAVGRLVEKKAPHLTLRAFSLARHNCPGSHLVLIGDGPMRAQCEALVASLGLEEHVSLLGVQPHDTVLREMVSARLFAQHSVRARSGDTEGTPVAVTEAQACGLPVVATRHGGISDVVEEGRSGFLVDEGDVSAMSQAMVRLLGDPLLAHEMGQRGRCRVEEQFSSVKIVRRLTDVLRSAAAMAGHRS